MIFLFNRITGMQDEENVDMVFINFIKRVFTVYQQFIVDLMEKYKLSKGRVKWIHNQVYITKPTLCDHRV